MKNDIKSIEKYINKLEESIYNLQQIPGTYSDVRQLRNDQIEVAKTMTEKENRIKQLQEKKLELKIKILESKKPLPTWWVEK